MRHMKICRGNPPVVALSGRGHVEGTRIFRSPTQGNHRGIAPTAEIIEVNGRFPKTMQKRRFHLAIMKKYQTTIQILLLFIMILIM